MPSVVIDASAAVDLLRTTAVSFAIAARIEQAELHAPHSIDLEVASSFRRHTRAGAVSEQEAARAVAAFRAMKIVRHPHTALLPRIWQLRHNLTAYDAAYVALAELLGAPLVTRDGRLARSAGHGAAIELIA